nr:MAG TPA: hypothetical protein [Caudoviricetes sp.]
MSIFIIYFSDFFQDSITSRAFFILSESDFIYTFSKS